MSENNTTIKTKYHIGDKVWYKFVGNNIKTTVRDIKIDYKGIPTYYCNFFLSVIAFREEELFPELEVMGE